MALPDSPLTRGEQYLNRAATGDGVIPDVPVTRIERYLAKIAGQDVEIPAEALTRIEQYLAEIAENGGGGGEAVLIDKTITADGTYLASADDADGFKKVIASVLPSGINAFKSGTKTFSSETANITITHNLGVMPKVFVFWLAQGWYPGYNPQTLFAQFIIVPTPDATVRNVRMQTVSGGASVGNATSGVDSFTDTIANFKRQQQTQGAAQPSIIVDDEGTTVTATYRWIAIA